MENQIRQIESFFSRFKQHPVKCSIYAIISFILFILGCYVSGFFGEKGRKSALYEQIIVPDAKPESDIFEDGWTTYHRYRLNKKSPVPFEVGNCPSTSCYRFSLGPRKIENGVQIQTIYLAGGGFEKHIRHLESDVKYPFYNVFIESKGGRLSIPVRGGPMFAELGLFRGASLRIRAIDQDILLVVEDDRINYLTVGVAIYDGTYCELYRKGLLPPSRKIPECEE